MSEELNECIEFAKKALSSKVSCSECGNTIGDKGNGFRLLSHNFIVVQSQNQKLMATLKRAREMLLYCHKETVNDTILVVLSEIDEVIKE